MVDHHFSTPGLISISHVNDVFGWVCKCQYASAICLDNIPNVSKSSKTHSHPPKESTLHESLTASELILASGPKFHSFVLGISITPSMMA